MDWQLCLIVVGEDRRPGGVEHAADAFDATVVKSGEARCACFVEHDQTGPTYRMLWLVHELAAQLAAEDGDRR